VWAPELRWRVGAWRGERGDSGCGYCSVVPADCSSRCSPLPALQRPPFSRLGEFGRCCVSRLRCESKETGWAPGRAWLETGCGCDVQAQCGRRQQEQSPVWAAGCDLPEQGDLEQGSPCCRALPWTHWDGAGLGAVRSTAGLSSSQSCRVFPVVQPVDSPGLREGSRTRAGVSGWGLVGAEGPLPCPGPRARSHAWFLRRLSGAGCGRRWFSGCRWGGCWL